ncbi:peptidase M13 [Mycobacteroides abscessus]|nr:M13-type metalloendopeptidase [Mycobacteroides abscessus]ALM18697.1 peptidase M13 [Mycobacteroides abscessus]
MTTESVLPKSGIDLSHRDESIRPQDDLFGHVNGRWLAEYAIPADRAVDGAFRTLFDRAEEQVREIITEAADSNAAEGTESQKIGDLFASFMDTETVSGLGLTPLQQELDLIASASDTTALAAVMGVLQRAGVGSGVYREEQHAATRDAYRTHIAAMFTLVYGDGDHADTAGKIVALETKIAAAHWDVVKRRDAELSYNLLRFADLEQTAPGFDWSGWLSALGAGAGQVTELVVRQPDYLTTFGRLWATEPLSDWKLWASWRLICARAPYLTDPLVNENFDFYGRTLSGTEQIRDRWKRGVAVVESLLGEAVGQLYVARHFPPNAKARMEILVDNLREAYRVSITDLEWMTPQTRERALQKLDKFTPKIGYPATWRDYSTITIRRDDLLGNVRRATAAECDRGLAKLAGPVDRDEWFMTPQTVNAYYNPGMNEIVFPAAILQPPFFDADADDAANYGGIGAVIGHEIGHGFDDQGSKYDGDGNLVNWWTDTDRDEFGVRTKALIKQYDEFVPRELSDQHVNGAFTVGENIGDLGGLSIALLAYEISLGGGAGPVIDGLTGVQRVFYGWAQVWRTKAREAEAIRRLSVDPHSPPEFRCNGVVRNIDAFYEAFGLTTEDELFLEADQRVRIWS